MRGNSCLPEIRIESRRQSDRNEDIEARVAVLELVANQRKNIRVRLE